MNKAVKDILAGTKYEGSEFTFWGRDTGSSLDHHKWSFGSFNYAGGMALRNAKINAAKAVCFDEMVEVFGYLKNGESSPDFKMCEKDNKEYLIDKMLHKATQLQQAIKEGE